ncbi:MAG: radical SAM protein [Nitrospiraceae bacterium]|nr:radical SAM protein [Nitrospiraceae bacterium]
MKVCEIFTSIQGESSYAGHICTFIRLSGCNLRCSYCDTRYAYDEGTELTESEIISEVSIVGVNTVAITGGEPLLQEDVLHLVERLINQGHKLLIETNGSVSIKDVDPRAVIVMDVKTPGSGMADGLDFSNLSFLKTFDEVKFVITDRADYVWSREFIKEHRLLSRCKVLFSPAFGTLEPAALAEWMIEDRLDVLFNLQLHKYIFGPNRRRV